VAAALAFRLMLTPVIGDQFPFTLFYLAVVVTAWCGGLRPALAALLLGALASDYFLLDHKGSFDLMAVDDVVGLVLFVATGITVAMLAGSMHSARRIAEAEVTISGRQRLELDKANELLESRVRERTQEFTRANARLMQSQDELQASESRFRSYVENAPIGILVADEHRRLVDGNQAAAKLFGYRSEEFLSLNVADIHAPENHAAIERAFVDLEATGYADGIFKLVRRDGTNFWASLRAAALPNGGSMAFIRDISEEKRIADELRIERDWFAKVVSAVPVVISSWRQGPDGAWSMPFANPRLTELYGSAPSAETDYSSHVMGLV